MLLFVVDCSPQPLPPSPPLSSMPGKVFMFQRFVSCNCISNFFCCRDIISWINVVIEKIWSLPFRWMLHTVDFASINIIEKWWSLPLTFGSPLVYIIKRARSWEHVFHALYISFFWEFVEKEGALWITCQKNRCFLGLSWQIMIEYY